jgi:hypothetical protein
MPELPYPLILCSKWRVARPLALPDRTARISSSPPAGPTSACLGFSLAAGRRINPHHPMQGIYLASCMQLQVAVDFCSMYLQLHGSVSSSFTCRDPLVYYFISSSVVHSCLNLLARLINYSTVFFSHNKTVSVGLSAAETI